MYDVYFVKAQSQIERCLWNTLRGTFTIKYGHSVQETNGVHFSAVANGYHPLAPT